MKNIIISILIATTILSCSVDLDQQPSLTPGSEVINAEQSLLGSYAFLQAATNEEFYFGTLRSDIGFAQSGEAPYANFDKFSGALVDASDDIILPYWFNLYRTIIGVNRTIELTAAIIGTPIEDLTKDLLTEDEQKILGEAQFLRAYSYFRLVQSFGDVPINTLSDVSFETNEPFERDPASEVYELIITDLTSAFDLLGSGNGNGRPTEYSAKALLAKVHMANGSPLLAEPLLLEVIENSGAILEPSYEFLFSDAGESSSEILFSVQYGATGDTYSNEFTFEVTGGFSRIINPATDFLRNSYEAGDVRAAATYDDVAQGIVKHFSDDMSRTSAEADWYALRLADIILLYAEAGIVNSSMTDTEVLALLDDIRIRAGLAPLDVANFPTTDDVFQAVKDERKVELAWEGHRWFDLVRWGDAKTALDFESDNYLLFPIPIQDVLATSGVTNQNPGY